LNTRLSHRLQRIRPSATVSISALALKLRAEGRDIIALSVGEPDFDTPQHIKAAAIAAVNRGDTKYTSIEGAPELKRAIVDKLRRDNRLSYTPEQILVSNGAKQSCYNACQALLGAGDEAVIAAPYWVSYPDMVRLADAEPVIVHTRAEQDYLMTPEQLSAAITPQTRLLFLNSPCNPTGAVYSAQHWRELGEVLREHPRVMIISDEIYEHIHWDETPFTSLLEACPHLYERTITVNGVSKGYAMSGWRIGYAAGPAPVIKGMTSIQSQCTSSACTISQAAARAALTGDQQCVREMRARFQRRHRVIIERVGKLPGFRCIPAKGAFYLFPHVGEALKLRGIDSDTAFCEQLLEATGVALVPGSAFGAPDHVRISFAASLETLNAAVDRIEKFMTA
jgi:aspartate aminotransferase